MVSERLGVVEARVLRAAVAVMHERDGGTRRALAERHPQRVEHERGAHVRRQLPTDDAAAAGVDDEREEHQALPAAQVGQVGDPQPIGRLDGEMALDQIGPPMGPKDGVALSLDDASAAWMRFSVEPDTCFLPACAEKLASMATEQWIGWPLLGLAVSLIVAALIGRAPKRYSKHEGQLSGGARLGLGALGGVLAIVPVLLLVPQARDAFDKARGFRVTKETNFATSPPDWKGPCPHKDGLTLRATIHVAGGAQPVDYQIEVNEKPTKQGVQHIRFGEGEKYSIDADEKLRVPPRSEGHFPAVVLHILGPKDFAVPLSHSPKMSCTGPSPTAPDPHQQRRTGRVVRDGTNVRRWPTVGSKAIGEPLQKGHEVTAECVARGAGADTAETHKLMEWVRIGKDRFVARALVHLPSDPGPCWRGRVLGNETTVREWPAVVQAVGSLKAGASVVVGCAVRGPGETGRLTDWVRLQRSDHVSGTLAGKFVARGLVELPDEPAPCWAGQVKTRAAPVYQYPSRSSERLGELRPAAPVTVNCTATALGASAADGREPDRWVRLDSLSDGVPNSLEGGFVAQAHIDLPFTPGPCWPGEVKAQPAPTYAAPSASGEEAGALDPGEWVAVDCRAPRDSINGQRTDLVRLDAPRGVAHAQLGAYVRTTDITPAGDPPPC
jgi:hypothetical protein